MTIPSAILGFFISTLYGALFHLWKDGGLFRLVFFTVLSWLGFWAGHFSAEVLKISLMDIGPLHLGMATLGSAVFLGLGHWLSLVKVERK
ncbi:MAG TPA: hypothetical protein PKW33_15170 [Anaerolineaceae bacterium]|nr:hypothetical protein [Anaerolineaceae bacterium]HPN52934.1 hypothetical protein [Anaerolineaceae bacterium]